MNRRCVVADQREIFACPLHAADFMRVEQGVVTRNGGGCRAVGGASI